MTTTQTIDHSVVDSIRAERRKAEAVRDHLDRCTDHMLYAEEAAVVGNSGEMNRHLGRANIEMWAATKMMLGEDVVGSDGERAVYGVLTGQSGRNDGSQPGALVRRGGFPEPIAHELPSIAPHHVLSHDEEGK